MWNFTTTFGFCLAGLRFRIQAGFQKGLEEPLGLLYALRYFYVPDARPPTPDQQCQSTESINHILFA